MSKEDVLRDQFFKEKGIKWENSQGEPDIEYVNHLEGKVINYYTLLNTKEVQELIEKKIILGEEPYG